MPSHLLPLFQIVGRLIFLTPNLTVHLIQKIYTNIVKFELLLKICLLIKKVTVKNMIFYIIFRDEI
jgi:hypothetical protein